jgi:hypothetical protein
VTVMMLRVTVMVLRVTVMALASNGPCYMGVTRVFKGNYRAAISITDTREGFQRCTWCYRETVMVSQRNGYDDTEKRLCYWKVTLW